MKEFLEGFSRLLPSVMGVKSVRVGLCGFPMSTRRPNTRLNTTTRTMAGSTVSFQVAFVKRGRERGEREGGALPSFWRVLVRGGGRLGWLEGVPFQTLRIDLFVDGTPSLHPVLVVVDHVLKLFQRFFYRFGQRDGLRERFDKIDEGWL